MLVQHRQHLERAALVRPIKDEIPGLDVVARGGLRWPAGRNALPGQALGGRMDVKAFFPPDPLDLLAADRPAFSR